MTDTCEACGLPLSQHLHRHACDVPAPRNVQARCPACGATFWTAEPVNPDARCPNCFDWRANVCAAARTDLRAEDDGAPA